MIGPELRPGVLLVHGLWMGPWSLGWLARNLAKAGCAVERFGYRPAARPFEDNVRRLARRLEECRPDAVVAHSLGGLLTLAAVHRLGPELEGRIVLLGTPLAGSAVAARLRRLPGGRRLLGHAAETLVTGVTTPPPPNWQVAMIAGTRRVGAGLLMGAGWEPGDGTVAVAETWAEFLAEHHKLPVTHTQMLSSRLVAETVVGLMQR